MLRKWFVERWYFLRRLFKVDKYDTIPIEPYVVHRGCAGDLRYRYYYLPEIGCEIIDLETPEEAAAATEAW
jgi:hypothetical protein